MKWPTVAEAWMYGDPADICDGLIARSDRQARRADEHERALAVPRTDRDRHYTQARRIHIKTIMRGKR